MKLLWNQVTTYDQSGRYEVTLSNVSSYKAPTYYVVVLIQAN